LIIYLFNIFLIICLFIIIVVAVSDSLDAVECGVLNYVTSDWWQML